MEFLLVGESKLKIVASEEEMIEYKLEDYSSNVSGAILRRSFLRVLDIAKSEVGFDPAGDKVLIQFYPIKSSLAISTKFNNSELSSTCKTTVFLKDSISKK